ncbi:Tar ligand binding domain-containing protein, partial [Wenzhouxiangella sp. XN24]|uniref:Tar ligand binding domain-containing protein n=1 Tax=Wenzhouxiangella sp. XN24 TaxID=2713569 RepID=UPI0013EAABD1
MFRKLTISARLYGLMGILSLTLIGVGMAGINGMQKLTVDMEDMYQLNLKGSASLGEIEVLLNQNIIEIFDGMQHDPRLAQTFADGHGVDRHVGRMEARTAEINQIFDTYVREMVATDAGRQAAAELDAARQAFVNEHMAPLVTMMENGDYDRASRALIARTLPAFRGEVVPRIDAMVEQKAVYAGDQYEHALEEYQAQRWFTIIAITIGVLLAGFLGWVVIARSFARPVNEVVAAANKMAAGDFDFEVHAANSEDEVGKLVTAVNSVQHSVQGFIGQMSHMSSEHDKGDIDVMIAAEDFEGDYRTMAEGVNGMVNGHIAVKKKAMACVAEFGRGNFEAELEKFPGKKRFINDTIEKVRENLKALIVDANMLSEAALAGKLATRADAKRHEGDFRKIVEGVNATLDAVVVPVNEVKRVMVALSEGDLTQKIQGNYQGDFKVLQEAVDDSIDKLNSLISGIKGSADAINTAAKE